jgi:hypothetical protein
MLQTRTTRGHKQDVHGESSDEEDWMVHTDEANGFMDYLGMGENSQFDLV